jgi:hypothetical protein
MYYQFKKIYVMNFKKGQKVYCVNGSYNSYCIHPIKKGSVYTIHGWYYCLCGSSQVTLKEFPDSTKMGCRCHRTSVRRQTFYSWRFIPLDMLKDFVAVSRAKEKTKVTNTEIK